MNEDLDVERQVGLVVEPAREVGETHAQVAQDDHLRAFTGHAPLGEGRPDERPRRYAVAMSRAVVRYEVFVKRADPYSMIAYMRGYSAGARHRRVAAARNKKLFRPPSFMCVGGGVFRQPLPFDDAKARLAIEEAAACYVVEYDSERDGSLWYLDAALQLATDIAKQCKGVIVDRTADALVTSGTLQTLRKGFSARDTVSLCEVVDRGRATLATVGMSKYAQADFVLSNFPLELAEVGRRLLYDNLCAYSMGRTVLPGQTFGGRDVRMIFVEDERGRLEVRDIHPRKKAALKTSAALQAGLRRVWEAQTPKEASTKSRPVRARRGQPKARRSLAAPRK